MRLLSFSPFNNVWVHAFPQALLAESAQRSGFDVDFVTCGGLLRDHCVAMEEANIDVSADDATRGRVCATCTVRGATLTTALGLRQRALSEFFSATDEDWVVEQVASVRPDTWQDFEVDGIQVGRYASYEFLLKYKINQFIIPNELFSAYQGQLANALRTLVVTPRLLTELQPDRAIAYNTLYSTNRVFMAVAERAGIPCFTMQGGNHPKYRGETMTVFRNDQETFRAPKSAAWQAWKVAPISGDAARVVVEAIENQFSAKSAFVYTNKHTATAPSAMRESLGIHGDAKVALVALSSRDELFAADVVGRFTVPIDGSFLFDNQSDWVAYLIDLAGRRPDLHLVIRAHPREFPNKRESVMSPNVERLKALLQSVPANVTIDWPTDRRSLYDVMQVVDVVLSGWSSVGGEASLFGMSVVTYKTGEVLAFPSELVHQVDDITAYESTIDKALDAGWSIEHARLAFRWYAFNYTRLALNLADSVPSRSTWSARRVAQGMYTQTRAPVPFAVVHALEKREVRRRATMLQCDAVFADVLQNLRSSAAESEAWPERVATTNEEEDQTLKGAMLRMLELLGSYPDDSQCLSTRIESFIGSTPAA